MTQATPLQPEHREPPHTGGDALAPGHFLSRLQFPALIAGIAALVLCVLGLLVDRQHFFRSYLVAYLFWLGVPLGCLALLMLQYLTGGNWGLVILRLLEAGARMLPLMALLFIPLLFGMGQLYVWDNPSLGEVPPAVANAPPAEVVRTVPQVPLQGHVEQAHASADTAHASADTAHASADTGHAKNAEEQGEGDENLAAFRHWWLQKDFFIIRAIIYFGIWILWALLLNRWSRSQDFEYDARRARRMQLFSGPGIVLYGLTITAAAVDWVMSIDPHWYSTIFGMIFIVGQALSAIALAVLLIVILSSGYPYTEVLTRGLLNDLGNLMFCFVFLWGYLAFSQFLLIWAGNVAEETPYYVYRSTSGWKYVAGVLIFLHFCLPFAILLSRHAKRNLRALTIIASLILVMRVVDLFWMVVPSFAQVQGHHLPHNPGGGSTGIGLANVWMYILAPIGIGGIWAAVFVWQLRRRPLMPPNDPRLEQLHAVAAHGGAH